MGEWKRGKTLVTENTRRWSKEDFERNDQVEKFMIFDNFTIKDEGRSRRKICHVILSHPEAEFNATLIAASPGMLEVLRRIAKGTDKKETMQEMAKFAIIEIERVCPESQ